MKFCRSRLSDGLTTIDGTQRGGFARASLSSAASPSSSRLESLCRAASRAFATSRSCFSAAR